MPTCGYPSKTKHEIPPGTTYWQTDEYGDICDACHKRYYLVERGMVNHPRRNVVSILWTVLGHIWALPGTLVGLLLVLPYGPVAIGVAGDGRRRSALILCKRLVPLRASGQTWGDIVFVRGEASARLIIHELVHVHQWHLWGPLFFVVYAGHYLWNLFVRRLSRYEAYRQIFLERQARRCAGGDTHQPHDGNQ